MVVIVEMLQRRERLLGKSKVKHSRRCVGAELGEAGEDICVREILCDTNLPLGKSKTELPLWWCVQCYIVLTHMRQQMNHSCVLFECVMCTSC